MPYNEKKKKKKKNALPLLPKIILHEKTYSVTDLFLSYPGTSRKPSLKEEAFEEYVVKKLKTIATETV